ncbi:putative site-specific recombinase [Vibrio nigripulchritudo SOn1]|uniref:Site-specific recombinase n=1 Tax=Vibrio nigripulchritudo SOn1 TaxID=1238450 RepID=A0AAV2VQI3_9VIBR|nr:site-specific integrase [Vibrio nigripulchritudo]CCO46664.1 putative site-specific recombinase [Vibrio nigripulchritudo SOn1]
MAQARSLSRSEMKRALDTCLLMSNPLQKQSILSLSFSGLRVTELTLLTVEDVIAKGGKLKNEIYLRASITKGCKPRTVWLSKSTLQILSQYIDHRRNKRLGMITDSKQYAGLNPKSKLILSSKGAGYCLKAKVKTIQDGSKRTYYNNDTVEALIRSIYARCGLHGARSHSGRRSLATTLNRKGIELEAIGKVLGHSPRNLNITLDYIDISDIQLEKLYSLAL